MKRNVWVVVSVWLVSCTPFHKPVARPVTTLISTTLELPSGMRVVIEERPGTKRVAMAVLVGSGGRHDPEGKEGLAHFVEHLVFRARPTRRLALSEELLYSAAADTNAFTSHDTTTFVGVAPVSRIEQFLPLMAASVSRPFEGVSDEVLEVERGVVRSELFTMNDPHGVGPLKQKVVELAQPASGEGRLRALGGTPESLARLSRDDVSKYLAANYRPEATTVVIAGDVTAAQVKALLPSAFLPDWLNAPSSGPRTPKRIESASDDWLHVTPAPASTPTTEAPVDEEHLLLAWPVPGRAAPGGALVPLLANGLRGVSSRVADSKNLLVDIDVYPGSRTSVLYLDVTLPKGVTPEEASAALRATPLHGEISPRAWRAVLVAQAEEEQDLFNVVIGRALRLYNGQSVNGAREANATEAAKLFDEAITWARAREMVLKPAKRTAAAPAGALPRALQERPPSVQVGAADFKAVAMGVPVQATRSFTLENGLKVLISRRTEMPLASVALTLPAGARHMDRNSEFWLPVFFDWRINNAEMNRVGPPNITIDTDTITVQDTELSTQLPVLIDWVGHFTSPTVHSANVLMIFFKLFARGSASAFRRLPFDLLPPDSRFRPFSKEDVGDPQTGEMGRFLDAAWRPNGAALVIDGDLDLDATEKQVRELFTDWSRRSSKFPPMKTRAAAPRRDPWSPKLVSLANKDTTHVEFGCRLPPLATTELRGGAELLQRSLQDYFEADLRMARGLTYSVRVRATTSAVEDNLLNVSLTVDARENQSATKRFLMLLDELEGAVWDDALVDRARWRVSMEQLWGSSGSSTIAGDVSEALVHGASVEDALNQPLVWSQTPIKWVDELWAACNDTYELRFEGDETTLEPLLAPRRK